MAAMLLFYQLLDEYRGLHPRTLAVTSYQPAAAPDSFVDSLHAPAKDKGLVTLTIEEVLPNKDWIALYARQEGVILNQLHADTVEAAMAIAERSYGIVPGAWETKLHL
ncbi:hypothetical protein LJ737_14695 [Hymenobacter sp. 15J16-1T3B]|uniref:hypothetical protein n=1 Tax=Hymenobacter sp. 15J16-1T3B TaxID=2886941 RepID=UPI001D1305E5|nr:hypothetical protein [Hymenobacter sp. 15J16-1T3B]MCC3158496.1 hypothetical protein [Hymenobacter sp. 15J16-1T3B]